MKIESIRIQGYRSLGDLTFCPGTFTVLVGPNNAGKSNIVDALGFLSDVYAHGGVHHAVDARGGFENLAYRDAGIVRTEISFEVTVIASPEEVRQHSEVFLGGLREDERQWGIERERTLPDRGVKFTHRFTIRGQGEPLISEFTTADEEVQLDLANNGQTLVFRVDRHGNVAVTPDRSLMSYVLPLFDDEKLAKASIHRAAQIDERLRNLLVFRLVRDSPLLISFLDRLAAMRTYQILPSMSRAPSSPTSAANLGYYGDNLAALVKNLQDQSPDAWSAVLEHMTSIVPDLEDIEVLQTSDKLWTLSFVRASNGRHWTASEMSDGTIRALALFSAIYDPRGSLLAIEEPENSLHPWPLQELVAACRAVSSAPIPKQIVVTTHSPALIDQLYPSEIMTVWQERSGTMLSPLLRLDPGVEELWADGKIKLSGFLESGLLRQAVPVSIG